MNIIRNFFSKPVRIVTHFQFTLQQIDSQPIVRNQGHAVYFTWSSRLRLPDIQRCRFHTPYIYIGRCAECDFQVWWLPKDRPMHIFRIRCRRFHQCMHKGRPESFHFCACGCRPLWVESESTWTCPSTDSIHSYCLVFQWKADYWLSGPYYFWVELLLWSIQIVHRLFYCFDSFHPAPPFFCHILFPFLPAWLSPPFININENHFHLKIKIFSAFLLTILAYSVTMNGTANMLRLNSHGFAILKPASKKRYCCQDSLIMLFIQFF